MLSNKRDLRSFCLKFQEFKLARSLPTFHISSIPRRATKSSSSRFDIDTLSQSAAFPSSVVVYVLRTLVSCSQPSTNPSHKSTLLSFSVFTRPAQTFLLEKTFLTPQSESFFIFK